MRYQNVSYKRIYEITVIKSLWYYHKVRWINGTIGSQKQIGKFKS